MSERIIRIMVVDDHEIVRKSITSLLDREQDMVVVGTAIDGLEAIKLAQTIKPDVIVMDISMPELDGIRAAGKIQALGIRTDIILLSMHYNNVLVQQARKNGVAGYIVKQRANSDLIPAIRSVHQDSLTL